MHVICSVQFDVHVYDQYNVMCVLYDQPNLMYMLYDQYNLMTPEDEVTVKL